MGAQKKYEAIVVGTSAGGFAALSVILEKLPAKYPLPVIIVQHRSKDNKELLEELLQAKCRIRVKQADEKEKIAAGTVYIAPPDYHLLVEADRTFSLSSDEPVHFSRPSIDVLFESAAPVYRDKLAGIILTGANNDGADGIRVVNRYGGLTIVQDPAEAKYAAMPGASIRTNEVSFIWKLAGIENFLLTLINS